MMVNEELTSWMRVDRFVCTVLIDLRVYVCIWRWIGYSLLCVFSSFLPHDGSMIYSPLLLLSTSIVFFLQPASRSAPSIAA